MENWVGEVHEEFFQGNYCCSLLLQYVLFYFYTHTHTPVLTVSLLLPFPPEDHPGSNIEGVNNHVFMGVDAANQVDYWNKFTCVSNLKFLNALQSLFHSRKRIKFEICSNKNSFQLFILIRNAL
jgi:hypothetical protein